MLACIITVSLWLYLGAVSQKLSQCYPGTPPVHIIESHIQFPSLSCTELTMIQLRKFDPSELLLSPEAKRVMSAF